MIVRPAFSDARASTSSFAPAVSAATSPHPMSDAVVLAIAASSPKNSAIARPVCQPAIAAPATRPAVANFPNSPAVLPLAAAMSSIPRICGPMLTPTAASAPSNWRIDPPRLLSGVTLAVVALVNLSSFSSARPELAPRESSLDSASLTPTTKSLKSA